MVTEAACGMPRAGRPEVSHHQPGKCTGGDGWPGCSDVPLTLFAQTGNSNEWGFSQAYISQLAVHSGPAVRHDRTELCVPAQEQVTFRTSLPVSGLEMVCSALLLSQPPLLLAFPFVKTFFAEGFSQLGQ